MSRRAIRIPSNIEFGIWLDYEMEQTVRADPGTLTSTSVAVSESPLSLPSGRSCSSAEMHIGSSTDVRDTDFWDGILRRERKLTPDWDLGICVAFPSPAVVLPPPPPPSEESSGSIWDLRGLICESFRHL